MKRKGWRLGSKGQGPTLAPGRNLVILLGSPISCAWIIPEDLLSRGVQQAGQPRINES